MGRVITDGGLGMRPRSGGLPRVERRMVVLLMKRMMRGERER